VAIGLAVALTGMPVLAADFFVDPDGSDSNDGLAPQTPFATIGRGAEALANPGDRVIVAAGLYEEGDIAPARGGGPGAAVQLIGDREGSFTGRPGAVIVSPPAGVGTGFLVLGQVGVTIRGFEIVGGRDAGIQVRGARDGAGSADVTIRDCTIVASARHGIDITASGTVQLIGNLIADHAIGGIALAGGEEEPIVPFLSNNILLDNGAGGSGHGIFIEGAADGLLQNNEIAGSGLTGITIRGAERMRVVNNLIHRNGTGCAEGQVCGHGLALGSASAAVLEAWVVNNTSYGNHGWGFLFGNDGAPSRGAVVLNNIFAGNLRGGVAVSRDSTCGYIAAFNLNADGYGPDTPFNLISMAIPGSSTPRGATSACELLARAAPRRPSTPAVRLPARSVLPVRRPPLRRWTLAGSISASTPEPRPSR